MARKRMWRCGDGNVELVIRASNAAEAAMAYALGYDRPDPEAGTYWVKVQVRAVSGSDLNDTDLKMAIDPEAPKCSGGREHAWVEGTPRTSNGAGIKYREPCKHCSWVRILDSGATDPADGQTESSVRYEQAE